MWGMTVSGYATYATVYNKVYVYGFFFFGTAKSIGTLVYDGSISIDAPFLTVIPADYAPHKVSSDFFLS